MGEQAALVWRWIARGTSEELSLRLILYSGPKKEPRSTKGCEAMRIQQEDETQA